MQKGVLREHGRIAPVVVHLRLSFIQYHRSHIGVIYIKKVWFPLFMIGVELLMIYMMIVLEDVGVENPLHTVLPLFNRMGGKFQKIIRGR